MDETRVPHEEMRVVSRSLSAPEPHGISAARATAMNSNTSAS